MSDSAIPILGKGDAEGGKGVAEGGEGGPAGSASGDVDLTNLDSDEGDGEGLQARLAASGAPTTLPHALQMMWAEFYEVRAKAPWPQFVIEGAHMGVAARATLVETFAWFFTMQAAGVAGELQLFLKCRLCPPSAPTLRVSFVDKGKLRLKFSNITSHITLKHADVLTTAQKAAALKQKTETAAAPASASAAGASASPSADGAGRSSKRPALAQPAGERIDINIHFSMSAYRALYAEFLVLGAQPFSLAQNLGFAHLCNKLGLPLVPATTAKRDVEKLYDTSIKRTIAAKIASLYKPTYVTADVPGEATASYRLTPMLQGSADGVTSRSGAKLESVMLHGGAAVSFLGSPAQLRPVEVLIAMHHFITLLYDAMSHASALSDVMGEHGISPAMISAWVMDTTATNPAILKISPWEHTFWIGCYQHVLDLIAEDLNRCPEFTAAFKPANDISEVRFCQLCWLFGPSLTQETPRTLHALNIPRHTRTPHSNTPVLPWIRQAHAAALGRAEGGWPCAPLPPQAPGADAVPAVCAGRRACPQARAALPQPHDGAAGAKRAPL